MCIVTVVKKERRIALSQFGAMPCRHGKNIKHVTIPASNGLQREATAGFAIDMTSEIIIPLCYVFLQIQNHYNFGPPATSEPNTQFTIKRAAALNIPCRSPPFESFCILVTTTAKPWEYNYA